MERQDVDREHAMASPGRLGHRIGGRVVPPCHGVRYETVPDPATGRALAEVPLGDAADVDAAVAAARAAWRSWSQVPVPKRARLMFRFQQILTEHADELARLIVRENGKTWADARGEVGRGIENVEFAAGAPALMMGRGLRDIADGLESGFYRYPVGVVGGITPFNFPMMVPAWMFPLAIACGNTFVLKPSERTPLTAMRLAELFEEAGLPPGVLNVVHGGKDAVESLLAHPEVAAVSFVGSQPTAAYVYREAVRHGKRVQALGGAKNHTIVMPDANLDEAVRQIAVAAFGSAGERCMACAVVVAVGEIADPLVAGLVQAADRLVIGNGADRSVGLGPVIREEHRARTMRYITQGVSEGAALVRDGRNDPIPADGWFIGPTIFDRVAPNMTIWQDEIFAPVLGVARVNTLSEAIALANRSEFANGACLFTDSSHAIREFRDRIDAGMLGINIGVPAPMAFFPFSGWKHSFYGDLHVNGEDGVAFFTRKKMVTARY